MKLLTREFSPAEKALLVVLLIIIMLLSYYKLIYVPTKTAIDDANIQAENVELELNIMMSKLRELKVMKNELDELESSGRLSRMESYNNVKSEIAFLNDLLSPTQEYSLSISDVTKDSNQIRRNISLEFTVHTYNEVEEILKSLESCELRCLVSDVRVATRNGDIDNSRDSLTVKAVATFYETMVSGTPDAGLPAGK